MLFACLGVRDPPASHLAAWFAHHRALGLDRVFLHDDHSSTATASRFAEAHPLHVTLLRTTTWPYWNSTAIGVGTMRARFVGQIDMLVRCVDAAVSAADGAGEAWIVNLDLDEYLMPAATVDSAQLSRELLPRALDAAAAEAGGAPCLSIRRHNFLSSASRAGNATIAAGGRGDGEVEEPPPLLSRTLRAPFPPAGPSDGQPFLPKWVLRVDAAARLVVNQHEVWGAEGCRESCAAGADAGADGGADADGDADADADADASSSRHVRAGSHADPAGLHGVVGHHARRVSMRLLAGLLSPLQRRCPAAAAAGSGGATRCVLNPRSIGFDSADLAQGGLAPRLATCLGNGGGDGGARGAAGGARGGARPWCWREACGRGEAVERHLRVHHYGHAPLPGQAHAYDLHRSGAIVHDEHALRFG